MIRRLFAVSAILLLAALPARAVADDAPPILTQRVIAGLSLDDLFVKLKENAGTPAGSRVEQEILNRFGQSGSPTADLLLSWATNAIEEKNYTAALDVLDQIIVIKPDFAEAWNKRATVYYLMENFSASLSDIRATLKLQPRHFGALAGFGMILQALDRKPDAIRVYQRALDIDPQLENVKKALDELEKEQGPAI